MTSQRITLENAPFNLCRRVTVTKPKMTFKILEELLKEGVSGLYEEGFESKEEAAEKIETDSDKEIIALIAYLQRVGTDIKMMPQAVAANK
jgi:cbb3-type cytochrome oxidase cytochrome c subunit